MQGEVGLEVQGTRLFFLHDCSVNLEYFSCQCDLIMISELAWAYHCNPIIQKVKAQIQVGQSYIVKALLHRKGS